MQKRLLCIVGVMNTGGAETFLMKMYRTLDRTKYQMDFAVAVKEAGTYDEEIISLGGKIYRITPKSQGAWKNFVEIMKIVKENNYQYVLRTSQHSLSALELFAAKLGGAKVRIFRSSNSNTTMGSSKQMLLHKICKFMPSLFANIRIAPSTEAAEFMFGKGCISEGKAVLINNAIDTDYYAFSETGRNAIRNEFSISSNTFVIGHIGRFNQQKNHKLLIAIFKRISNRMYDSVLLLVGVGELQEAVKQYVQECGVSDRVIFANIRNDIPEILSAMDVLVFPSLYEGMPNTVIEAQANGLPCVIADTITKEADITGLVHYLPLNISAEEWAKKAIMESSSVHINTARDFAAAGYDIESATKKFVNLVFGE